MPHKLNINQTLHNMLFVLLLLAIASGLGYLLTRYHLQRDITHNAGNSLEPASVAVLRQLAGPINITVYASEQDARLGDIRKAIRGFMTLYQRYKPDMHLTFIDPEKEPEKTRAAQVKLSGEMVVEFAGRNEHLTQLNEQIFTSALLRLAHRGDLVVMYLDGHGERKLDGIANHDLGNPFGAKLKQNGFHLISLNLALAQEVPSNASVLVITQPQLDLMPGEVDKVLRHVDRGGNLLWLVDAEPLHGLERLAEKLDLLLLPGILIDPAASEMNAPSTWALGAVYPPHAITHNFDLITAFPFARPLAWNENQEWQHSVLVEAAPRGWVSRNASTASSNMQQLRFDKRRDSPGPAIVALSLSRNVNDREQRIVVVGSGAFLANSFAGNGGNVDLGVSMVNWLSGEDQLIALQPHAAKDSNLVLGKTQITAIGIGFLLVAPLLLSGAGMYIWWKRRRE